MKSKQVKQRQKEKLLLKCREVKVYAAGGGDSHKSYRSVQKIWVENGEVKILTVKDYICFDMAIVGFYECLDYELERPIQ